MKTKGNLLILVGSLLVLVALGLFLWNQHQATQAERVSREVLSQLTEAIPEEPSEKVEDTSMTVVYIDGYGYVGYIAIPKLGIELPVMEEWDYTRLKIAPCRYQGFAKTNDFIIAAHNYRKHFGRISTLSPGDEVIFTDMDGVVYRYQVAKLEDLKPTQVERMKASGYDLTLFTCTYRGRSRTTVRCERIEG